MSNDQMNDLIRAASGHVKVPAPSADPSHSRINDAIRGAAGYLPTQPEPPTTAATVESGESPDANVRALLATEAGLPVEWGERLRGDSPAELAADARSLAADVADARRDAAPPIRGGLDGGAHGSAAPAPPSVNGLLRAHVEDKARSLGERAHFYDQLARGDR